MAPNDGERWIVAENVGHFLKLLDEERDPEKRKALEDLLRGNVRSSRRNDSLRDDYKLTSRMRFRTYYYLLCLTSSDRTPIHRSKIELCFTVLAP